MHLYSETMRKRITLLFLIIASVVLTGSAQSSSPVMVGILDTIDPWFYVQTFGPTMEHLRKAVPSREIRSIELSFEDLQKAVKAGELDFFIAPSGFFAYVAESAGARHVATRHPARATDPAKSVGSVFVVRAEDTRFKTLKDLRGALVAATDRNAFDGWIIALGELLKQKLEPNLIFANVLYSGYGIPDVASMVLNRQADVGVLKACDIEQYEKDGTIEKGSLRVLNEKKDSGLACKVSTELYPDVVFASLPKADSNLVKAVSVGLLTMPETREGDSWGFASDFTSVSSLYRALKMGPYEYLNETGIKGIVKSYGPYLLGFLILLLTGIAYTASVRRIVSIRTRDLTRALKEKDVAERDARISRENLFNLEKAGVVSELSAMFAHEAHQPIASLVNYADGLKMYFGSSSDPVVNEALSEISEQADRLSKIIQKVRNYAKRDKRELKEEDLSLIVDKALTSFHRSSSSVGVKVLKNFSSEAWVLADGLELELLIVNLLKNAAEALKNTKNKRISIDLKTEGGEWLLCISDQGKEISEELLQRLSKPTKSVSDGLGLGLSICRLIAENHGGRLTFEVNRPKGLVVTLHIPKYFKEAGNE